MLSFPARILRPYLGWYVLGTVALIATNLLSVTIPVYLATGVDALPEFDGGRVVEEGPPAQIFNEPQEQRTQDFLHAVLDRD